MDSSGSLVVEYEGVGFIVGKNEETSSDVVEKEGLGDVDVGGELTGFGYSIAKLLLTQASPLPLDRS